MGATVVLFSGGRGSAALTRQLVSHPGVSLTVAINGYDDGASTGAVRRFLGDSLGPSDFRKNTSTLANELGTCSPAVLEFLDRRLPADAGPGIMASVRAEAATVGDTIAERLARFDQEDADRGRIFDYRDCAIGNLVFGGSYLLCGGDFNRAVDDYAALAALPAGLIENVTDGADATLVAVGADGRFFPDEASIVAASSAASIDEIFLVARPLDAHEEAAIRSSAEARRRILDARSVTPRLNPRLAERIAQADLIVFAPGTQHSSLFPSYLTAGLAERIGANLRAIKLLVTNIESDVEITGSTGVDLIDRALFYLRGKGRVDLPAPALITHYLLNDPGRAASGRQYVPVGQLDSVGDPRLFRISNYEDGVTGRHDGSRVLGPFVEMVLQRDKRPRVAVLLHDGGSANKLAQSLVEFVRGGIEAVGVELAVFYPGPPALDEGFLASLPFTVRMIEGGEVAFQEHLRDGRFDYALLFESSGMYRGEDGVALCTHLAAGRLDAVWGSRRLSVRDIQESYAMRYRRKAVLGGVSYLGSHVLSLAYLAMFGRYISDTLSGVRALRASHIASSAIDLGDKVANHQLLSRVLRRKEDLLEVPVQFLPLSPHLVKRTTVGDGLRALATIVMSWLSSV